MNHYELMIIVDPSTEEGVDEVKQKVEGIITGREGAIETFDKIGKKRLAYPIAKKPYGFYLLVNFKANSKIIQALDYYLRLNPSVLRFIILALSEKELKLRRLTERVQLEEAERMRQGGRPIAGPIGDIVAAEDVDIEELAEIEEAALAEAAADAEEPETQIEAAQEEFIENDTSKLAAESDDEPAEMPDKLNETTVE